MKSTFLQKGLAVSGALVVVAVAVVACRGQISEKPPIHPNPNMDQQERYDPQEPNPWFADRRAMRPRVDGTTPFGSILLPEPDWHHYYLGCQPDAPLDECKARELGVVDAVDAAALPPRYADGSALQLDPAFVRRGQERFNIYCAPCHDNAGTGNGLVAQRSGGRMNPRNLLEPAQLSRPVGYIYRVISEGAGTMGGYRNQIPPDDRWRIAAYVRTLQLASAETESP